MSEQKKGRRILKANLVYRFYRADGWSREDVRKLLRYDQRLARVIPRYFDERDYAIRKVNVLNDGLPHDECAYYAVYDKLEPFDMAAMGAQVIE